MSTPPNPIMGDTVVPGQTPGTTPPFVPGPAQGQGGAPGQGTDPLTARTQQILSTLLQAAQRRQVQPTGVPAQVPGQQDPRAAQMIGMNTAWPSAWGGQRAMASIGTNIRNAVAKQKGDQLLKAEGDWQYLQSSLNELYAAQQSGDQQAAAAAQKKVDVTLGDPKKLKNMAKALNQDWLNPEKTTVYGEALKKTIAQTEQKAQQEGKKAQAAQGLKSMMQHLIGKATQPQLSDEDKKRLGREIQEKAPTTQGAVDPKTMIELQRMLGEEAYHKESLGLEKERMKMEQGMEQQRIDVQKQDVEMRSKERVDQLQFRYDQLQSQIQGRAEALEEKKLSDSDRATYQRELLGFRAEQLAQQRDLAEEKLKLAGTPKERKNWIDNELKELMKSRDDAQKNRHWYNLSGDDEYKKAADRVKMLQGMADDITSGAVSKSDAINKIYSETPDFIPIKGK